MDRLTGVINCFSGKKFLLKEKKRFHFPKTSFLINNCYFQVGNIILRKELSSQWVDILLYFFRTCSCFIMNMSDWKKWRETTMCLLVRLEAGFGLYLICLPWTMEGKFIQVNFNWRRKIKATWNTFFITLKLDIFFWERNWAFGR